VIDAIDSQPLKIAPVEPIGGQYYLALEHKYIIFSLYASFLTAINCVRA